MMNKMRLLIGLLVLGILLIGGGMLFLFLPHRQAATSVTLTPDRGSYIYNSQNESSRVLLQTVQITKTVSDKKYSSNGPASNLINIGDPVIVVSGSVQNNHPSNTEITLYAAGYDASGKQVAWTHDESNIVGQIGLHLENGETGEFTLHLNYSKDIKSIRIFANSYSPAQP